MRNISGIIIMKKPEKLSILLLSLVLAASLQAQDYTYSQFYANPIYLNPALAGSDNCPRITLNYRDQWPQLPAAFISTSASYDQYVDFVSGGVGVQFQYDKSGEAGIRQFRLGGMYAYRLDISDRWQASMALEAAFGQRGVNWNDFIFPSQIKPDGTVGTSGPPPDSRDNVNYADFATGFVVGFDEKFFVGGAVHHLTTPDIGFISESDYKLPMKITIHAGANIETGDRRSYRSRSPELTISPNILYQQQGDFRQLNVGSYFTLEPFVGGLWYRHAFENPDAVIVLLGLQYNSLKLGYSFDYTLSSLAIASGGAHEISVGWLFDCNKKSKRSRAIKCPSF
ncbi:MAG TPA: type IX secretion system membrane protein PorP/SprF [Bacteroidales bacterium]|nr:type IX secretion system membrane protein PorP/SprF [Bacteroidales bacterium]